VSDRDRVRELQSHTTLINPPISGQKGDPHTGIPFMPFVLAYLAAALDRAGAKVDVIDAFGLAPRSSYDFAGKRACGLTPEQVAERVDPLSQRVFLYARAVQDHDLIVAIARLVRRRVPRASLIVVENSQAVTSFSLRFSLGELFPHVDYALLGECEETGPALVEALEKGETAPDLDGLARRDASTERGYTLNDRAFGGVDLDSLPAPLWERFPLQNYWSLRVGHGPVSDRYLTVLSSRGCPYPCTFCVVPDMTGRRWRGKPPVAFVDELETLSQRFGVSEFHLEDVNATVAKKRMIAICEEIRRRRLAITWKLVSGIKIETVDEETLRQMASDGCRYLSFSPESGSPRVLKLMKKCFDHDKALRLTRVMADLGIHTQACFVLGYPGESDEDRRLTEGFVRALVRNGLKEVALFIFTPVPGSEAFGLIDGYQSYSELSFSPSWRRDYAEIARFRRRLYLEFFAWKCLYQPVEVLRHAQRLFRRRFQTKMEMVAYRVLSEAMRLPRARPAPS
jgi:radical SAM superfamily enzyme YgiQ (UPF0313 family)